MDLNQITVPAADVERAAGFYRRLGLRQIVASYPDYARFECPEGEATFSLERVAGWDGGPAGPVVYFECAELDRVVADLEAAGVAFESGPRDQPWLWREARLRDSEGNRLCLFRAGRHRRDPPWRLPSD